MPAISSSCALYDLVLDRNWLAVVSHCEMYPQDAAYSDPDTFGETPLYLAMNWNPPLFAVRALIKANPDATSQARPTIAPTIMAAKAPSVK